MGFDQMLDDRQSQSGPGDGVGKTGFTVVRGQNLAAFFLQVVFEGPYNVFFILDHEDAGLVYKNKRSTS